jgi:hypothetical protein
MFANTVVYIYSHINTKLDAEAQSLNNKFLYVMRFLG